MSRSRLTVVLSQAQGKHPAKRALEESIVAALLMEPGLDVSVIPHLYDLHAEHTGRRFLGSVSGDMVVLSWLFPRAAFWLLDRDGIKGHLGETQLKPPGADEDEEDAEEGEPQAPKGIGAVAVPDRHIYCLDLRDFNDHEPYVEEIRRIALECRQRQEARQAAQAQVKPALVELGLPAMAGRSTTTLDAAGFAPEQILKQPDRRWYPVIDYSRCTNCMECIDFCLFGVYGVDKVETILVEQPDNCRKGCPACSRVCPENAIIFPQHKTPTIAGAPVVAGSLKIDLSKLFGAPETGETAEEAAIRERDEQLLLAGRQAVGATVGLPKRHAANSDEPKDELDSLIDALDNF